MTMQFPSVLLANARPFYGRAPGGFGPMGCLTAAQMLHRYRADRAHFLAAARRFRAAGDIDAARDEADEMRMLRAAFQSMLQFMAARRKPEPAAFTDATMTTRATRQAMADARKRVFRKARRERIAVKEAFLRASC